jgi:hypothetical protein
MARAILVLKMLRIARGFPGFRGLLRGGFVFCAVALLIPTACGSSEDDPPPTDPADEGRGGNAGEDGRGGTSGSGGSNGGSGGTAGEDTGGSGGEGGEPPTPEELAPVVTILSPESLDDPSEGPVLIGGDVRVLCRAEQSPEAGSEEVDGNSVVVHLLDEAGESIDEVMAIGTEEMGEYTATVSLLNYPNGVVSLRCEASDVSSPHPRVGSDTVSTFVDNGPAITVTSPLPESVYAQQGDVPFEFEVTASPLTDDDDEAQVDSVTLEVANLPVDLEENEPGVFTAVIDPDGTMFDAPLSGPVSVVIRATNHRSNPGPATRAELYDFLVDAEGPDITILNPTHESIIGGVVTLEFTVEDELAGVEPSSIVVSVNRTDHPFDPVTWPTPSGDRYRFVFDSRLDWGSEAQVTITIAATDTLLNPARPASMLLYLDNRPPVIDLDPETIRELRLNGTEDVCSYPFDPLGVSPNDVTPTGPGLPRARAFVWDDTNSIPNVPGRYIGTDQESVYIYLQPDGAQPVIVNTTSPGGVCNAINPALSEETRIQLAAVPQEGEAFYGTEDSDPALDSPPMPPGCGYQNLTNEPNQLCYEQASDLTRVTQHGLKNDEPVVYSAGDLVQPDCTGAPWEIMQFFEDDQQGWFCLAAIATDLLGNVSVSRPLRLCYDNPNMPGVPACWNDLSNPPSCTDGCALPPRFGDVFDRTVVIDQ